MRNRKTTQKLKEKITTTTKNLHTTNEKEKNKNNRETNEDIKSNEREHERTPRTRVLKLVSCMRRKRIFTWMVCCFEPPIVAMCLKRMLFYNWMLAQCFNISTESSNCLSALALSLHRTKRSLERRLTASRSATPSQRSLCVSVFVLQNFSGRNEMPIRIVVETRNSFVCVSHVSLFFLYLFILCSSSSFVRFELQLDSRQPISK